LAGEAYHFGRFRFGRGIGVALSLVSWAMAGQDGHSIVEAGKAVLFSVRGLIDVLLCDAKVNDCGIEQCPFALFLWG
jgi:hypothetical protein